MTTGVTVSAFTSSKRQNSLGRYDNLYQITISDAATYTSGSGVTVAAADFGTTGMTTITAIFPAGEALSSASKYYGVSWNRSSVKIGFTKTELVGGLREDIGTWPGAGVTITFIARVVGT